MESSEIIRPVILLIIALLIYHLPICLHKARLTGQGVLYFLFCNDKKWKKLDDPLKFFSSSEKSKIERKTIIFVRHGESTWNETFNKGPHRSVAVFVIGFIPNLVKALLYEGYLLLTGQMDSWFYDSPLSPFGIDQIEKLSSFLAKESSGGLSAAEEEMLAVLRGDDNHKSLLVSSSLRRALSTVAIAFERRLERQPKEKIHVIPPLQEISRNPDTLSITPAYEQVTPSWIDRKAADRCNFTDIFQNRTDMSLHYGNKPLNTNGYKRMVAFCEYAFSKDDYSHIICGGHSIWFRSFFKTFLPLAMDHLSKKKKIVNGGTVAFTLLKTTAENGECKYMIDPKSILVVYGGFA